MEPLRRGVLDDPVDSKGHENETVTANAPKSQVTRRQTRTLRSMTSSSDVICDVGMFRSTDQITVRWPRRCHSAACPYAPATSDATRAPGSRSSRNSRTCLVGQRSVGAVPGPRDDGDGRAEQQLRNVRPSGSSFGQYRRAIAWLITAAGTAAARQSRRAAAGLETSGLEAKRPVHRSRGIPDR